MKVLVIGGAGLIGTRLVNVLRERGHDVVSGSRATGVDALSGEGLAGAMARAEVVVDVLNSPSFEDAAVLAFFETSTRNLLAAEKDAGVRHHVALSVVGADRIPDSGYMRAKAAQEKLIGAGGIPFTVVRATQFLEFAGGIAWSGAEGDTVRLPPAGMQPVAADDVVSALADIIERSPSNGLIEVAGPEKIPMNEFVARFLAATGDSRRVIADENARYFGAAVNDTTLTPAFPDPYLGSIRYADWLSSRNESR